MKTLGIILLSIYIAIAVFAMIIQIIVSVAGDQTSIPWGMIFKQSVLWLPMLIKIIL